MSSMCAHNMANLGPLTAEICRRVCGIPANFNGFRVLPSLLQRRRSLEAKQTLHDVWPSPGLLHYMYTFGALAPDRILPGAKFSFWATVCKTVCPVLSDRCLSVCNVGVLWPNGLTDQDETWHAGTRRPWPHCVG